MLSKYLILLIIKPDLVSSQRFELRLNGCFYQLIALLFGSRLRYDACKDQVEEGEF